MENETLNFDYKLIVLNQFKVDHFQASSDDKLLFIFPHYCAALKYKAIVLLCLEI